MVAQADPSGSFSSRDALRSILGFHDGPWRWSAGIQAGVAIGGPLAAFTLAGHQSLGLIASLGAFTALYGSTLHLGDRLYLLPLVAVGFVAASGLGVLTAANAWATVASLVAVAVFACTVSFGIRLGAPGPMHFVLVAGISNHLAGPTYLGGASIEPVLVPALVAVGALGAYLLIVAPLPLPVVRRRDDEAVGLRGLFPRFGFDDEMATIAARVVVAVAVAGLLSLPLGVHRAYWLMMVAGAVLQTSYVSQSNAIRAVHRIVGTVCGVAVFGLIELVEPRGLWLVAVVALLEFAIEVVVARHYALALTFITPVALTISAAGGTDASLTLVSERVVDTFLGAAIAMAVLGAGEWIRARRGR
jgi:hypothetical protein